MLTTTTCICNSWFWFSCIRRISTFSRFKLSFFVPHMRREISLMRVPDSWFFLDMLTSHSLRYSTSKNNELLLHDQYFSILWEKAGTFLAKWTVWTVRFIKHHSLKFERRVFGLPNEHVSTFDMSTVNLDRCCFVRYCCAYFASYRLW